MNKKVYVCPSVMTRDVRVSMVCVSPYSLIKDGKNAAVTDIFERGGKRDGFDLGLNDIDVDNSGIWGNGID